MTGTRPNRRNNLLSVTLWGKNVEQSRCVHTGKCRHLLHCTKTLPPPVHTMSEFDWRRALLKRPRNATRATYSLVARSPELLVVFCSTASGRFRTSTGSEGWNEAAFKSAVAVSAIGKHKHASQSPDE